jgi:hypothetical protein
MMEIKIKSREKVGKLPDLKLLLILKLVISLLLLLFFYC